MSTQRPDYIQTIVHILYVNIFKTLKSELWYMYYFVFKYYFIYYFIIKFIGISHFSSIQFLSRLLSVNY